MSRDPSTRDLSDKHEAFLAELFDGRVSKGSGNQFSAQMDGRNRRYDQHHALAWEGKSSRGKSISIARDLWAKAVEQSHGETTLVALRFYGQGNALHPELDLAVLDAHDFVAILNDARAHRQALGEA